MKLKADRAALLKALAHVQSVVERRNTIPILANVMIAVRDGKLTLTATDMEIAVLEDVPASPVRNGATTAPAATLYEIVRKLPEGAEVELDHPGGGTPSLPCVLAATRHRWSCCRRRIFPPCPPVRCRTNSPSARRHCAR